MKLLTLGVELEAVAEGYDARDRIAKAITNGPHPATAKVSDDGPSTGETSWIIAKDYSIAPGREAFTRRMEGVELISPVFTDADTVTRLTWHSEICDVLGSVCSTVLLRTNESTGYHVHICIGKAPGQTFTLDELKKIAVITILYEKAIDELHPAHRSAGHGITNTMLRSNRSNLFFVDYETSEVLEHILSARDVKQLTCMMNPALDDLLDSDNKPMNYMRDYKVNFVSVSKYGTIEFRQHEGTIDPAVVCAWADFLLALIRYAMKLSAKTMITLDPNNMPLVDIVGKDVYAPLMLCGQ